MTKKSHLSNRKTGAMRLAVPLTLITLLCVVMVGFFTIAYVRNLRELMRDRNINYLQEITGHIASEVENTTNANLRILGISGQFLHNWGNPGSEEAAQMLRLEEEYWNFFEVALVDENGNWFDKEENWRYKGSWEVLDSAVREQSPAVMVEEMDGKSSVVFIRPLDGVQVDGRRMTAIVGIYRADYFTENLKLEAFDGQAYGHIIDKEGKVVLCSCQHDTDTLYNNILRLLSTSAEMDEGYSVSQMHQNLERGGGGFLGFTIDGERQYITYQPIEGTDWNFLCVIPAAVVDNDGELFIRITGTLCFLIACGLTITILLLGLNQIKNRRKLEKIAYVDPVTGGNTQAWFEQEAAELLQKSGESYVLLYTNVDKFKMMNEREGRAGGDQLLKLIYGRMETILRQGELICRLSADHFALLLRSAGEEDLMERLKKDMKRIEREEEEKRRDYRHKTVGMSIGAYFLQEHTLDMTTMLDRANIARTADRKIRINNKVKLGVYDDRIRRRMLREKELEEWMDKAMEQEEFEIYLQPKMELATGHPAGAEALVRWISRKEGMIYPDEFIPLFERNGFIARLDLYMFRKVCALLVRWEREGRELYPISVNLSKASLSQPKFFDPYEELLKKGDFSPELIEFEFTESVLYDNVEKLTELIDRIHSLGCCCSMDDFGSSYSSLNMLKDAEVDTLKLDQAFFRNVKRRDGRELDIVEGVIAMAKKLKVRTVAEGVELEEQVDFLRKVNCDLLQGFIYSKPLTVKDFEEFIWKKGITSGT